MEIRKPKTYRNHPYRSRWDINHFYIDRNRMNIDSSSLYEPCEMEKEVLTLKELFELQHDKHEKFAYDKKSISKQKKVAYLFGKWKQDQEFVADYKVVEKSHKNIVKIYLPPRKYCGDQWEEYYEGYILQGVTTQSFTHPNDVIELRKLYQVCCPSTQMQFHTKCSGSVRYGNKTKVFQLTDLKIFLSLLSHGYTLFSVLENDLFNSYANPPIP